MVSGIYMIKNLINEKVYIGKSINVPCRLNQHKRELRRNVHHNKYLQRSWNKYGENNFVFTEIEVCDESILNQKEMYYISKYKSNISDYGFNLTIGGDGSLGLKHTEESKKKISEVQIGKKLTDEHKKRISESHKGKTPKNINMILERNKKIARPIVQIKIEDESISFWDSIQECARNTGILATNIVKCLKGIYKTCGNSIFLYKDDFENNDIILSESITKRTTKKKTTKEVVQLSLDLELIAEYSSMKELEDIGFTRQSIWQACGNKIDSYKGYKWMYKDDYLNRMQTI